MENGFGHDFSVALTFDIFFDKQPRFVFCVVLRNCTQADALK